MHLRLGWVCHMLWHRPGGVSGSATNKLGINQRLHNIGWLNQGANGQPTV